jgi:hypothetical protein
VITIDEDPGVSGKVLVKSSGFDHLNAEVAPGRVGILLSTFTRDGSVGTSAAPRAGGE